MNFFGDCLTSVFARLLFHCSSELLHLSADFKHDTSGFVRYFCINWTSNVHDFAIFLMIDPGLVKGLTSMLNFHRIKI